MTIRKEFKCPRRNGTKAIFVFVKPTGSVWHWDLPKHLINSPEGITASLPLPDVNLDKAKDLKTCLDLIGKVRGQDWVGQVVTDLLKPISQEAQ